MSRLFVSVFALGLACAPSNLDVDRPRADGGAADAGSGGGGGGGGGGPVCIDGQKGCTGKRLKLCQLGQWVEAEECSQVCVDSLGCVACEPGTGTCANGKARQCRLDGSGYGEFECDAVQGNTCNPQSGRCEGACTPERIGRSYIGCEYYPTVTANIVDTNFEFALAVSNTSGEAAQLTVEGGALASPLVRTVAPGEVSIVRLPWVTSLKGCTTRGTWCASLDTRAAVAKGGAYRLRSTRPVTVYQFNPLDYRSGASTFSYTNDASLLLPSNALSGRYVAAAWPQQGGSGPSLVAVTATQDGTQVTVNARAAVAAGATAPAFAAGTPKTVSLGRGDVLQLLSTSGDLTGSEVTADKPVQVISGHACATVPQGVMACDHLEESMFPVETLSKGYLVTAPSLPTLPNPKEQVVRVIAAEPDVILSYDPPLAGAGTRLAKVGDFLELPRSGKDFKVLATKKVLVVQYMEGQDAGGNSGDPSMTLAAAVDQYRKDYQFHAPTNYEANYVTVIAPAGATVTLDGQPVTGFAGVGGTGFQVARPRLGAAGNGNHRIASAQPFGILVYGYGQYTSYWYPGGLDLLDIPFN